MAKGLRIGDAVTVRTERRLPRNDPAYKQGLKRLRPGEMGQVVGAAEGRSVVVEFDGKRVTLSSQSLDKVVRPPAAEAPEADRTQATTEPQRAPAERSAEAAAPAADLIPYVNTSNPGFVTTVANTLLSGGDDPDRLVVELRLRDLPARVQKQIRALMQAKLALGPQAASQSSAVKPKTGRRGRQPGTVRK
jgi:hypothetical protein